MLHQQNIMYNVLIMYINISIDVYSSILYITTV